MFNRFFAYIGQQNHEVAFFADVAGGSFQETFPRVDGLPVHAYLVLLDGAVEVSTVEGTAAVVGPSWSADHAGDVVLEPQHPPLEVPFGDTHTVRTVGGDSALWAYVFGAGLGESR